MYVLQFPACLRPKVWVSLFSPIQRQRSSNPATTRSVTTASIQNYDSRNEFTRRKTLKSLLAGLALVGTVPNLPAHAADERRGEINYTDKEWRELLTPDQYAVLRRAATERRNSSPLVQEHRKGVFLCAGCGSELFLSTAKYESGTGWPSFYDVIPGAIDETLDDSIPFMVRTEIRCHRCQSHCGHVFSDGPEPTGLRYCMNGVALVFKADEA